jgi:hypothetical protein
MVFDSGPSRISAVRTEVHAICICLIELKQIHNVCNMISFHEAMMNIFCEWWFEPAVATVSFVLFNTKDLYH